MKFVIILCCLTFSLSALGQKESVALLKPTGQYKVGTVTYEWTDDTREIKYNSLLEEKRTIIVQIWYPALIDSNSVSASYNAISQDYRNVESHSYARARFNDKISISNLILVSPGRGTERFLYTTLIEDLASHGFVVASVDMPEIGYTIYGDGFILKPSNEFQTPQGMMAGPYEKVDSFYERPTAMGFNDLEFAIRKISELNDNDPNNRFTSRINTKNIGIFGHSLGGRIAGELTARNKNIKAYISMEGIPPRDVRYEGKINIPIAMLCSSGTLPYALENYNSLIENRSNIVYMIELPEFGHNSVTDNPFIYPDNFKYAINPEVGLILTRRIVRNYIKSQLHGGNIFNSDLDDIKEIKFTVYKK